MVDVIDATTAHDKLFLRACWSYFGYAQFSYRGVFRWSDSRRGLSACWQGDWILGITPKASRHEVDSSIVDPILLPCDGDTFVDLGWKSDGLP